MEEGLALDDELFEQAELLERELIDDYVRKDLGESEMQAFEANYLRGARRREKVNSAEILWRIANEQQTKVFAPGPRSSRSLWEMLTAWKLITGVAVILLGYGLVYYALNSGKLTVELGTRPPDSAEPYFQVGKSDEPEPLNNTVVSMAAENENVVVPNENIAKPNPKRPGSTSTVPSAIATFTLSPGALRNEGEQAIKIVSNTTAVDLRLAPAKDAPKYQAYSVTLKTADGETILSDPRVRSPRLRVAANKLENRTYIVFVEGLTAAGTSEPVAEYTFRVRR